MFDDRTAVMMVDADGSRLRVIVDANPGFDFKYRFHADVSPDGSHIVYTSCQYPTDGLYQVYEHSELGLRRFPLEGREKYFPKIASIAISGPDRRRLTEDKHPDESPSWSPDGTRIAFMRGSNSWSADQLHSMPAGGEQHGVTNLFLLAPHYPSLRGLVGAPVWSPNGERLAVVALGGQGNPHQRVVYTVRADGSGFQRVSDAVSVPSWSPDGSRLALAKYHGGRYVLLVTVAPDGSNPRIVATITEHVRRSLSWIGILAWSPDGTHIMFTCDVGLCVANLQGDLVGKAPFEAEAPRDMRDRWFWGTPQAAWSPDGSRIAVRVPNDPRPEPGGNPMVFTMDPDGTNVLVLVRSGQASRSQSEPLYRSSCRDGSVVPEPERNQGLVGDCEVLKLVKDVMAYNIPLNWSSDVPIDQWEGITIGGSPPRVTGLELLWGVGIGRAPEVDNSEYGVQRHSANLRPELAGLTKLQRLSLAATNVVGTVPTRLASLADLRHLYIKWSDLQGCLPTEFSDLWVDSTSLERCEVQSP